MDWIVTIVGLTGFWLAGRKIWWSWYVNLGCQALWVIYALQTEQYAFLVSAFVYTIVFGQNARRWTKEHREQERIKRKLRKGGDIEILEAPYDPPYSSRWRLRNTERILDHGAAPGPLYWDFKCLHCGGPVSHHASWIVRLYYRWVKRR